MAKNVLAWVGIVLFAAIAVFLLQWPLTRPWLIGTLTGLTVVRIVHLAYLLVRGQRGFDRATLEDLALCGGAMFLIANMVWDRPWLSLPGCLLMMVSVTRAWHEGRRVSDSSGPVAS